MDEWKSFGSSWLSRASKGAAVNDDNFQAFLASIEEERPNTENKIHDDEKWPGKEILGKMKADYISRNYKINIHENGMVWWLQFDEKNEEIWNVLKSRENATILRYLALDNLIWREKMAKIILLKNSWKRSGFALFGCWQL